MKFDNLIAIHQNIENPKTKETQLLIGFIKTQLINELTENDFNKIFICKPVELVLDNLNDMSEYLKYLYPEEMLDQVKEKFIPIGQHYRDLDSIRDNEIEFQIKVDFEVGMATVNLLAGKFNDITHKRGITVAPRYTFHRTNFNRR